MLATVQCVFFSKGLRESEVLASIKDFRGKIHSIRIERDFLSGDRLTVSVIGKAIDEEAILIELPHEAETGANRLWVSPDSLN